MTHRQPANVRGWEVCSSVLFKNMEYLWFGYVLLFWTIRQSRNINYSLNPNYVDFLNSYLYTEYVILIGSNNNKLNKNMIIIPSVVCSIHSGPCYSSKPPWIWVTWLCSRKWHFKKKCTAVCAIDVVRSTGQEVGRGCHHSLLSLAPHDWSYSSESLGRIMW